MAKLPADSIEKVEKILSLFGIAVPGHAKGQVDQALLKGITDGLKKVETKLKLPQQAGANTVDNRKNLLKVLDKEFSDAGFKVIKADFKSDDSLDSTGVGTLNGGSVLALQSQGYSVNEFTAMVELSDNLKSYMDAFAAVETYTKEASSPAVNKKPASTNKPASSAPTLPSNKPVSDVDKALQDASAGQETHIENLQHFFSTRRLLPDGHITGRFDDQTIEAYRTFVATAEVTLGLPPTGVCTSDLLLKMQSFPVPGSPEFQAIPGDLQTKQGAYMTMVPFAKNLSPLNGKVLDALNEKVKSLAPVSADPSVQGNTGGQPQNKALADPKVKEVIEYVEDILIVLSGEIGDKIKEKGGVPANEIILPEGGKADGIWDKGVDQGLQQILNAVRSSHLLGYKAEKGEINTFVYSDTAAKGILLRLKNSTDPEIQKLNKQLEFVLPFKDPDTGETSEQGTAALFARLDYLKKKGVKFAPGQVAQPVIPELSGIQSGILQFVVGFLGKMFPSLLPFIDGVLRDFTGGKGLLDLVPGLKGVEGLEKQIAGLPSNTEERMKVLFKNAFGDDDGKPKSLQERGRIKNALMKSIKTISYLPWGDEEYRRQYPGAVDAALNAALKEMEGGKLSLDGAADIFAAKFVEYTNGTRPNGPAQYNGNPSYVSADGDLVMGRDPTIAERLLDGGFDPNGDGQLDLLEVKEQVDLIQDYYNILNKDTRELTDQVPLFFKGSDGSTYVAAVEEGSNQFTIQRFKAIGEAFDKHKLSMEKVAELHPGYNLVLKSCPTCTAEGVPDPYAKDIRIKGRVISEFPREDNYHRRPEFVAQHVRTLQEWADDFGTSNRAQYDRVYSTNIENHVVGRNRRTGQPITEYDQLEARLRQTMYDKVIKDIVTTDGKPLRPRDFDDVMDRHDKGLSLTDAKQAILDQIKSVAPREYQLYRLRHDKTTVDPVLKAGFVTHLDDFGMSPLGDNINLYVFSREDADSSGKYFAVNVAEELARYKAYERDYKELKANNPDAAHFYETNEALMERHFPALTAVRQGYSNFKKPDGSSKYDDAFDVARELADQYPEIKAARTWKRDDMPSPRKVFKRVSKPVAVEKDPVVVVGASSSVDGAGSKAGTSGVKIEQGVEKGKSGQDGDQSVDPAEIAQQEEIARKAEEAARRAEETAKKAEEEATRKAEEAAKKVEEIARKTEEEAKKAEEEPANKAEEEKTVNAQFNKKSAYPLPAEDDKQSIMQLQAAFGLEQSGVWDEDTNTIYLEKIVRAEMALGRSEFMIDGVLGDNLLDKVQALYDDLSRDFHKDFPDGTPMDETIEDFMSRKNDIDQLRDFVSVMGTFKFNAENFVYNINDHVSTHKVEVLKSHIERIREELELERGHEEELKNNERMNNEFTHLSGPGR